MLGETVLLGATIGNARQCLVFSRVQLVYWRKDCLRKVVCYHVCWES